VLVVLELESIKISIVMGSIYRLDAFWEPGMN